MANCVDRKISELLTQDLPDSEVKESKFKAEVTSKESSSCVKVSDGESTASISFAPGTNKRYENMARVGAVCTFYKLERQNGENLVFTRSSYMKEEKAVSNQNINREKLSLSDLVGKKSNEIIPGELTVKVWELGEVITTSTGRQFQKIKLGDDKFTVDLTLWNKDIKVGESLLPGMVISLKNFTMDGFSRKSEDEPLNLSYRGDRTPLTTLCKMKEWEVPNHLRRLEHDAQSLRLKGEVNAIDEVKTYKSCPGKAGTRCGKMVREGNVFCAKVSCRLKIVEEELLDDYFANISLFAEDGEIHLVRCFKKVLEQHEQPGSTVEERLDHMVGMTAVIKATKNVDPSREPLVQEITFETVNTTSKEIPKLEPVEVENTTAKSTTTNDQALGTAKIGTPLANKSAKEQPTVAIKSTKDKAPARRNLVKDSKKEG